MIDKKSVRVDFISSYVHDKSTTAKKSRMPCRTTKKILLLSKFFIIFSKYKSKEFPICVTIKWKNYVDWRAIKLCKFRNKQFSCSNIYQNGLWTKKDGQRVIRTNNQVGKKLLTRGLQAVQKIVQMALAHDFDSLLKISGISLLALNP